MPLQIEQEAILDLLSETRAASVAALANLDLSLVDSHSGWCGYDVLAQLAAGEAATSVALAALQCGEQVIIPAVVPALALFAAPRLECAAASYGQWQRARQQMRASLATLAWEHYHQRLPTTNGAIFVGELIKRLIGYEQVALRAILGSVGRRQAFDGAVVRESNVRHPSTTQPD